MRPKRSSPTGVTYSPHARFTAMLLFQVLSPAVGGACVVAAALIGVYSLVDTTALLTPGTVPNPPGVDPSTRLSSMSICDETRRLSLTCNSGFKRKRRFAPAWLLSSQSGCRDFCSTSRRREGHRGRR